MGMSIFTGKPSTYFQKEAQSQVRREKERMLFCLAPLSPSLPFMSLSDRKDIKSHKVWCRIAGSWKWALSSVWVLGTQGMQKLLQNQFFVNKDYIKVKINIYSCFKTDLYAQHKSINDFTKIYWFTSRHHYFSKCEKWSYIYDLPTEAVLWIRKSSGEEQPNCIIIESEMVVNFPPFSFSPLVC